MNPQQAQEFQNEFIEYIRRLGRALGFEPQQQNELIDIFQNFAQGDRYRLIENTDRYVRELEVIDNQLRDLPNGILSPYMDGINGIRENWNNMNKELAKLQILSLLQKKNNCDAVIKELLNILNKKITSVNEILTSNLEDRPIPARQSSAQGGIASAPALGISQSSAQGGVNVTLKPIDTFRNMAQGVRQQVRQSEAGGGVPQLHAPSRSAAQFQSAVKSTTDQFRKQAGGTNDNIYMNKYLKYKNKYISLKNGIL